MFGKFFKIFSVFMGIIFMSAIFSGCAGNAIKSATKSVGKQVSKVTGGASTAKNAADLAMDVGEVVMEDNKNSQNKNPQATTGGKSSAIAKGVAAGVGVAAVTSAVAAADSLGEHWIQDTNTGIFLYNPEPTDGETISWSGGYVQDGDYKFADGRGTVIWQRYGKTIQIDEGGFSHGRHHGQFKHTFTKSGRVEYSNWNNGVEIR